MNQLHNLLHDSLIATGHVENCAIVRRTDASLRANSVGFVVLNVALIFILSTCDMSEQ